MKMIIYQSIILLIFSFLIKCSELENNEKNFEYIVKVAKQGGDDAVSEGRNTILWCDVKTLNGSFPINPGKIQYTWTFNDNKVIQDPRKHSNHNKFIIVKADYSLDYGEYKCTAFIPPFNRPITSDPYFLHIHWTSKFAEIIYFKYSNKDDDLDLPLNLLKIEPVNVFERPFTIALQCKASGYPGLQIDWYRNGELIIAPNGRYSGSKFSIDNNNLLIKGESIKDQGVISCTASNSVRSLTSKNNFVLAQKDEAFYYNDISLLNISDIVNAVNKKQAILTCNFTKVEGIHWFHPNGSFLYNSSKYTISEDDTTVIINYVEFSDEGLFKCTGYREKESLTFTVKLQLLYIDEFEHYSILALYNQLNQENSIVVPEHCKFEILCLPPEGNPEPKIHWLDKDGNKITNRGSIRVLDNNQLLIQNALLEYSGKYSCVAENEAGKTNDNFEIKVQKLPLLINLEDQIDLIMKEKENVTLECLKKENNDLNPSYFNVKWFYNGTLISNNSSNHSFIFNNGDLLINKLMPSDEGLYVCQLDHTGYPLQFSAGLNLKVIELLKFVQIPVDKRLELNRSAKIHCRAKSSFDSNNLKIKWIKADSELLLKSLNLSTVYSNLHLNINDKTFYELNTLKALALNNSRDENGYLLIKNMSKNEEGFYTCLAYTSKELIFSTIRIDGVITPKFVKKPLENIEVFFRESAKLDCEAFGDPKPTIRWDKENDSNLINNNPRYKVLENGTLIILNSTDEDEGNYGCLAGNSGGFIRAESYLSVKTNENLKSSLTDTSDELSSNHKIQKTVAIALSVAFVYILAIIGLLVWFRCKRIANQRLLQNEVLQGGSSSSTSSSSRQGTTSNSLDKCALSLGDNLELKNTYQVYSPELQKTSTYLINDCYQNNLNNRPNHQNLVEETFLIEQARPMFDRTKLQTIMLLGHGEFGEVFLAKANSICKLDQDTMVMVKTLQNIENSILDNFNEEINMFEKINNCNVARLLATCSEKQPYLMILEYSDWGDLKQFLLATRLNDEKTTTVFKPKPLDKNQIFKIALQISNAMNYLSSLNFVHKDLATRNCLISSNLDIKITSCSLSKDTYCKEYIKYRNRDLPLRWSPNEAIFQNEWSKYSDIWSFAVLFWEILFLAEIPYSELRDDQVFNMLKCNQLKLSFTEISWLSNSFIDLLTKCFSDQKIERPEFSQFIDIISNELNIN